MKTDTLRFRDLLQKDLRLVVPLFQRPYVWNQQDQWEPLWEDIRNIAEDILHERFRRPHFLGDNPPVGLILCAEKDEVVAKYSVLEGSRNAFAKVPQRALLVLIFRWVSREGATLPRNQKSCLPE